MEGPQEGTKGGEDSCEMPQKVEILCVYCFWEEPDQRVTPGVTAHTLTMNLLAVPS